MPNQPTLAELMRRGEEAFLDARDAIATARRIVRDCRELNAELKRNCADFERARRDYGSGIVLAIS